MFVPLFAWSTSSISMLIASMATIGSGKPGHSDEGVADLLKNLNLTVEEGDVAEFSDDEVYIDITVVEWTIIGKVLSLAMVHANMIYRAMKLVWG